MTSKQRIEFIRNSDEELVYYKRRHLLARNSNSQMRRCNTSRLRLEFKRHLQSLAPLSKHENILLLLIRRTHYIWIQM